MWFLSFSAPFLPAPWPGGAKHISCPEPQQKHLEFFTPFPVLWAHQQHFFTQTFSSRNSSCDVYLVQPNEFPNKPFLFLNLTLDYLLLFHKFSISLRLWKYRLNWFHSSGNHQLTPFLIMTFNYEQRSPEDSEFWNKSLRKMCPQSVKLQQKSVKQPSHGKNGISCKRQWNKFPWDMWKCASSGKTRAAKHSKLTVRQEIISDLGKDQRRSLSWSCLNCKRKSPVPRSFKNRKCLFPKKKLSAE